MKTKIQHMDTEILVVDDLPDNLKLLANILRARGYRVRPATSGQLALRSASLKPPDLVLLDIKMPDMEGYEVCRILKSDAGTADVPVIFISALDETRDKVRGFEAGGVDFITKPFQAEEVLARVETHLSLRRLHQQLERQNAQLQKESAERLETERELREANDFNRKILEAATMGVLAYNGRTGQCVMANQAAGKIINASVDQLIGQNFRRIAAFQTPDRMSMVEEVLNTGIKQEKEVHVMTSFGREVWLECHVNRFLSRGEPHLLLLLHDVTEQKHFQEALKQAKEAAETANRAKSEFLANMSHEIRTPLNAVIGFSDLLSSIVNDPKHKNYIEAIQTAGESLLRLINDILDLSKIEASKLELHYSPANLRTIINEVEQIFSQQIFKKNIQFLTEVDPELPIALFLDEIRLRQVLINLVGNAVKFTQKGHIKLTVSIADKKEMGNRLDIDIFVEDTGIGISKHDIVHIFEAFRQQTGQSSSKFGGTGLGLTICKRLVEMMDGTISVKSVSGKGSVFMISIRNVKISHETLPDVEEKSSYETIKFEKATVLVVDDVQSNRELLSEVLSKAHLDVLTAVNGMEALTAAAAHQPDIILMDLWMPVMDGIEATGQLNTHSRTKTIPVIAVSAFPTPDQGALVLEKGFNGFLSKPFKINRLFAELSKYLQVAKEPGPHSGNEGRRGDADSPVVSDVSSPQSALHLSRVIDIIDSDLMARWKQFQKRMPMKIVRQFGKDLEALGEKYTIALLSNYSRDLLLYANNFDVEKMKIMIERFPETVNELRASQEKHHDVR